MPYSCQEGECGSCACTVTEGEVQMDNSEILDAEGRGERLHPRLPGEADHRSPEDRVLNPASMHDGP